MNVALLAALALVCVTAVALPLLRPTRAVAIGPPELLEALEERDRALAALRELEFDHRAGAIGDDEYRVLVRSLRLGAAESLKRVDDRA